MNSFISNFKPLIIALIIIAILEVFFFKFLPISQKYNTNLLVMGPLQKEKITRVFLVEKINRLSQNSASFVQVGDSSGFYGIRPNIIMDQMENKDLEAWVNFGCCGKTGFAGYTSLFDIVEKQQKEMSNDKLEYFVLAMTPYYNPKSEFEDSDLAESLENEISPFNPSAASTLRLPVTNALYKGEYKNELLPERINTYWGKTLDQMWPDIEVLEQENGWMEHPADPTKLPLDACEFDFEKTDLLNRVLFRRNPSMLRMKLEDIYKSVESRGYKFMIVLNPVPCALKGSESVKRFNNEIRDFASDYPDVILPFTEVRQYPAKYFRDKWHLNKVGANKNSKEIGQTLNKSL